LFLGGCPTLSYALYINDGLNGTIFNEVDSAQIRNKPYLNKHTVANLNLTGNFYKFQVEIINEIGSATSLSSSFLLASVPQKPSKIPV
jgi:hypothetical protein